MPASAPAASRKPISTMNFGNVPGGHIPVAGNPPKYRGAVVRDLQDDRTVHGQRTAFDACQQEEQCTTNSPAVQNPSTRVANTIHTGRGELGYKSNLTEIYDIEDEIGHGASGTVSKVVHKATAQFFACKSIAKSMPGMDAQKREEHLEGIKREIFVLKQLSSCLNVAKIEDVFESDTHVHIVQELCMGGELEHNIGKSHYSERTVASYMRAVLKTLAQCHVHNILHRDIKPGNFMLVSKAEDARIKAIDFGLAVEYTEDNNANFTMQGTPWFLAPETLSSKWSPKSDVWAAGVMTHQLLTGRLPFNDRRNVHNPALSAVLRSILTDKLDFEKACWTDISDDGKAFVKYLLNRDPDARPTAQQALQHPWLQGDVSDRNKGKPLSFQVVQRVQRYGRNNILKRSLLNLMVSELMEDDRTAPTPSSCRLDSKGRPLMDSPSADAVKSVLKYLNLKGKTEVLQDDLGKGLQAMGYRLSDTELQRLMSSIGGMQGSVSSKSVIASQIDWQYLQHNQKERWLELTRRAFDHMDFDSDGKVSVEDLMHALENRIPADELNVLFEAATEKGGVQIAGAPASEVRGISAVRPLSFRTFMSLLRQPSEESLDLYDDHLEGSVRTAFTGDSSGSSKLGRLGTNLGKVGSSGHLANNMEGRVSPVTSAEAAAVVGLNRTDGKLEGSIRAATRGDASHHGRDLQTVFEREQA